MDKEMLIKLFNSSESIAEICRKLYGKNRGYCFWYKLSKEWKEYTIGKRFEFGL